MSRRAGGRRDGRCGCDCWYWRGRVGSLRGDDGGQGCDRNTGGHQTGQCRRIGGYWTADRSVGGIAQAPGHGDTAKNADQQHKQDDPAPDQQLEPAVSRSVPAPGLAPEEWSHCSLLSKNAALS